MLTEKQKKNIISRIMLMPYSDPQWLSDYHNNEKEYIIDLIIKSTGKLFILETNGTASCPESITKFRKIRLYSDYFNKPYG